MFTAMMVDVQEEMQQDSKRGKVMIDLFREQEEGQQKFQSPMESLHLKQERKLSTWLHVFVSCPHFLANQCDSG